MSWNKGRLRSISKGIVGGLLLAGATGCQGPLAPTPGFGEEVKATRDAMRANPDAGTKNQKVVEGLSPSTANGVIENYHTNEKIDNQVDRQKATKGSELKF